MTTLLALDTATQACSVALLHDDAMTERFAIAPRQHTDLVLPMIEELLAERALARSALQAVAFGAGPGSFMGTRLAAGVAQGLAYALGIPVIPLSTLQIIAQTAYEQAGFSRVISAWDARMGEVYWGVYEVVDGLMQAQQSDQLSKPNEIILTEGAVLVGNAWPLYWEFESFEYYPHAQSLLSLAAPALAAGQVLSALAVEPVYLREKIA